jgi:hypothetical protein
MHKSRAHLVLDSERLATHRFVSNIEKNNEKRLRAYESAMAMDKEAKSGDGDRPMDTMEAALGRSLYHHEIILRLSQLNRNLYFEVSPVTKRIGLYLYDATATGTPKAPRVRYLGMTLAQGLNPEFTPKLVDEKGDLKRIASGYRTVLMRLIKERLITEAGVVRMFGTVDSANWQRTVTK